MLTLNPAIKKTLMAVACLSTIPAAQSAISLDRTRAIFNGGEKSMTLNIANDNKQLPYLAQAWLENAKQEKITTGPLVVTPPVQRLEPGVKSMVRVAATPDISKLPQDRESLFYFNLREIPPKSDKANVLQIALQTKIKFFYRPASVKAEPNAVWQDQLILNKTTGGWRIENPTPYYITLIGLGGSEKEAKEGKFEAVMLAPKSEQTVKATNYSTPWLTYINDYGGRPALQFQCAGPRCTAVKK
ncbi:molecular chaperone [Salmonella enterica subsp. enterica serovar Lexington]|uniref:Fimbria/pilus periplasmic chaperone n=1 Tax=Salmonella enterica TaxID=28901 RepID=A0A5Y5T9B4_SALER|nr:molecular chaperone [Salmonella enterica subsp. enterica serovar Weltevreden]EAC0964159.1 molecular chaperone [Salmonella enterica subsp. enterica serovar Newport]EAM2795103.1 molecular chaperone [Salmonella enterica]EBR9007989.1 molecular chaperone [Salmonella enterica subsp. enterica serovar Richmond]EBU7426985.1 molecular chaperone [Salmonella enterica subsp. enterica serovar Lexington]EBU7739050.1 molecular chaperone [Salmonella enterica subsp. enterica serovar Bareilly]EBX4401855.1 mo